MDYCEQDNGASGRIPEFGAIFMSNIQTKKECFRRSVFALPSSHSGFVTRIKVGMVLFLFEFRKRELFGVYQASSDGAVDIVPHAFKYSGQHFPAQVCFRQIWHCDPIYEKCFQDAIKENYFSAKKFNFGLSKDQVRRLLYLFSSRKMTPQPRSVDIMDRRLIGNGKNELSERGYMTPTEYDDNINSLARGREDEGLVDNRVDVAEEAYPFHRHDFLAKRRRISKEGRLSTNGVAENDSLCRQFYERSFSPISPQDSLDEARTLDHVQSSEHFLDPLERMHDDYTSMHSSTLPDDCRHTFASDHYENLVGQSKHMSDDDRLLLDDCVKRSCNAHSLRSVTNSDDNVNLGRQAREIVNYQELLVNRRHHLDCDGITIGASDPCASLSHKMRKLTAAGRFQIDDNEPNFGAFPLNGLSSKNILIHRHCGCKIIEDMEYPTVEGRSTESMADKVPTIMATNAANTGRETLEIARFRKRERADNQEASHAHSNPVTSMRYSSTPQPERKSSFSDKFPERQLSRFTASNNDLSRSTFSDATITRSVPYLPDHPNLYHRWSVSNEANQNPTSTPINHLHDCSLENLYPQSSSGLQQNLLKYEVSSRPLDITAHEFQDNGFVTRHQGSSNSFVNPNISANMDWNTSAPVDYRGSSSSKLSPPYVDLEGFEGEKGLLPYYSKSRNHHFTFDGHLPKASEYLSKHVPQSGVADAAGKDFSFSPESSGANSSFNRRSVFTRLSSKKSSQFEGRNDIDVNYQDCYMNATADEVMEMLKQDGNEKSRVVGRPRDSAVDEQKAQCHTENDHSTMEKEMLNNESQVIADRMDEIPKETRTLDFKRRSERKKNLFRISDGSVSHSVHADSSNQEVKGSLNSTLRRKKLVRPTFSETVTASDAMRSNEMLQTPALILINDDKHSCEMATSLRESETPNHSTGSRTSDGSVSHSVNVNSSNQDVKGSINSTFRRKKLVRPTFSKTDTASDAMRSNEMLQTPALILIKDDKQSFEMATSLHESEIPNDSNGSSNMLVSHTREEMESNKERTCPEEEQKDVVAHVLLATGIDLKGHEHGNDDLHIHGTEVQKETISNFKSLEKSKLAGGCRNNPTEKKQVPNKMEIILTAKEDVEASSQ